MIASRHPTARAHLAFGMIWMVLAAIIWLGTFLFTVSDLLGGNATATVVHVYTQQAYTISFTLQDGVRCEAPHKWSARTPPVKVGDTFAVHYSKISPCDNVEREDDLSSRYGAILVATFLLVIGYLNLRSRVKGPTRPGAR